MAPLPTTAGAGPAPTDTPRRRPVGLLLGGVLAVVAVAGASGYLTNGDAGPPGSASDPGLVHVHGLGVNPPDGRLYAATHTGLFRVEGGGRATRIADRYQDTMGFTVAGPDRFLASGHPDLRDGDLRVEGKRPLLGLIESDDAGRTWQPRSLLGDADLHTIVAMGDLLVAYDSTNQRVLASSDGQRWDTRGTVALLDLAVDPQDTDRLVGVAPDGSLQASGDGGRSWTADTDAPGGLAVLRWGRDGLWAGGRDGTLHRRARGGVWTAVKRFDGVVEAIAVEDATLYVAAENEGILRSTDAGSTWTVLNRAPAR